MIATARTFATALSAFAALALAAPGTAVAADPAKLRIAVEGAYPPFSTVAADGTLTGFDIDIARALCERMKADCVLVQVPFDAVIPGLQARKLDAVVASMSITEERQRAVDFTDRYYRSPNRLVARKGSGLGGTAEALRGKRIGVQRASVNDRYATDTFKHSQVVRYARQDEAFLDLASGRVDAVLVDTVAASHGFLASAAGKPFEFTGPAFTEPRYFGAGAGIALRKGDRLLRERFNAAIASIRADGTYAKIAAKYFSFDIYGGAAS